MNRIARLKLQQAGQLFQSRGIPPNRNISTQANLVLSTHSDNCPVSPPLNCSLTPPFLQKTPTSSPCRTPPSTTLITGTSIGTISTPLGCRTVINLAIGCQDHSRQSPRHTLSLIPVSRPLFQLRQPTILFLLPLKPRYPALVLNNYLEC